MECNARKFYYQEGYSLVELAIVLIIIGLVVGGVLLKGGELIESARLNAVMSQVNEIRLATLTFQDRYQAFPGDYAHAKDNIHSSLQDGKSDGIIGGKGLDPHSEASQFWRHLAEAHLIPDPGKPNAENPAFGSGVPASKLGGGFTVTHEAEEDMQGHWIVLGAKNGDEGNGGLLTPLQAKNLDEKADDGNPSTGKVRARDGKDVAENNPGKCLTEKGQYNLAVKKPVCVLYFQLQ